jgi:hypothetical protein
MTTWPIGVNTLDNRGRFVFVIVSAMGVLLTRHERLREYSE